MKLSNVYKFIGASAIATTLAVGSLSDSALAQTNTPGDTTTPNTTETTPRQGVDNTDYDRPDWGWLGLIGLLGLAGLAGRKRPHTNTYIDPNDVSSTTYRK